MKLGWCQTGHHSGRDVKTSRPCPGAVDHLICSCDCHGKTKAVVSRHRRKRRKKGAKVFQPDRPTVRISYEDAVLITKKKIEEFGADHLGNSQGTYYFDQQDATQMKPLCIVGHILDELVEDKEELRKVFFENGYNCINVERLIDVGIIEVDNDQTRSMLTTLQYEQDESVPWTQALEIAVSNHPQLQEV